MPQVISPLEFYVKAYFRTNAKYSIKRQSILKGVALIDLKLGTTCCANPSAVVNLHTRFDDNFVVAMKGFLGAMPKLGNVQSLKRTQKILDNYLYCCATGAPTNGVVDDTANTFDWTNAPGYTTVADYEYTLNGGTTWTQVTVKPVVVGAGAYAIGQVGVRVKKGVTNGVYHQASTTLYNTVAYT